MKKTSYNHAKRVGLVKNLNNEIFSFQNELDDVLLQKKAANIIIIFNQAIKELDLIEKTNSLFKEGRAREILRTVRDTFLLDGYKKYKDPHIVKAVCKVIKFLNKENIPNSDVDKCFDKMLDLGLNPVPFISMLFEFAEEKDIKE